MFLQATVILSTGGVSASVHAGIPPPSKQTPWEQPTPPDQTPPRPDPQEQTPPGADIPQPYPSGADTPQDPPEQTSPPSRHPPEQTPPPPTAPTPQEQTTPPDQTPQGSRCQHMVNERLVRILLECILLTSVSLLVMFCTLTIQAFT